VKERMGDEGRRTQDEDQCLEEVLDVATAAAAAAMAELASGL